MKRIIILTALFSFSSITGYTGYTHYTYETNKTFEKQSKLIQKLETAIKKEDFNQFDKDINKLTESLEDNKYQGYENKLKALKFYEEKDYEQSLEYMYKFYTFLTKNQFVQTYEEDMLLAQYYLTNIYNHLGEYNEAFKYAEFVLENNNNTYNEKELVNIKFSYANGLFLKDSYYDAEQTLIEVLPQIKDLKIKENAYLLLAQIYHHKLVDLNKAVQYYLAAYELEKNIEYGLLLLDLYANNGDYESVALISSELLLNKDITNYYKAKVHSYQGIGAYRNGKLSEGLKYFVKSNNYLKEENMEADFQDANNIYSIYIYYEIGEYDMVKNIIKNTENNLVSNELKNVINEYKEKLSNLEKETDKAEEIKDTKTE